MGGRRRIQRGAWSQTLLRHGHGYRYSARGERCRTSRRRSHASGRGESEICPLGALRRSRTKCTQRVEFHREGLWRARSPRLFRSWTYRNLPAETGHNRLGTDFLEGWSTLVSHRRNLLWALGNRPPGCSGGYGGSEARGRDRFVRSELSSVTLEVDRRKVQSAGS